MAVDGIATVKEWWRPRRGRTHEGYPERGLLLLVGKGGGFNYYWLRHSDMEHAQLGDIQEILRLARTSAIRGTRNRTAAISKVGSLKREVLQFEMTKKLSDIQAFFLKWA